MFYIKIREETMLLKTVLNEAEMHCKSIIKKNN